MEFCMRRASLCLIDQHGLFICFLHVCLCACGCTYTHTHTRGGQPEVINRQFASPRNVGKLLIWCSLTRSLADRWGWARGFFRDCEGRQNCGNQTISGWKLGSHVGRWPWEWFHGYAPLGRLTGRKQTPGLCEVLTGSHPSLRRPSAKRSVNKQVNIPE